MAEDAKPTLRAAEAMSPQTRADSIGAATQLLRRVAPTAGEIAVLEVEP